MKIVGCDFAHAPGAPLIAQFAMSRLLLPRNRIRREKDYAPTFLLTLIVAIVTIDQSNPDIWKTDFLRERSLKSYYKPNGI
jgi:hypothetical protein